MTPKSLSNKSLKFLLKCFRNFSNSRGVFCKDSFLLFSLSSSSVGRKRTSCRRRPRHVLLQRSLARIRTPGDVRIVLTFSFHLLRLSFALCSSRELKP